MFLVAWHHDFRDVASMFYAANACTRSGMASGQLSINISSKVYILSSKVTLRLLDPWQEPDKLLWIEPEWPAPALIGQSNRRKGRKSNEQRWENAERLEENGREPIRQLRGRRLGKVTRRAFGIFSMIGAAKKKLHTNHMHRDTWYE